MRLLYISMKWSFLLVTYFCFHCVSFAKDYKYQNIPSFLQYGKGNEAKGILNKLGENNEIKVLNLPNGNFKYLPEFFYQLGELRQLYVNYSNLLQLKPEIVNLSQMVNLQLEYSELGSLPVELSQLTHLRVLNLKGVRVRELPDEYSNLEKLDVIFLTANLESRVRELFPKLRYLNNREVSKAAHSIVERNLYRKYASSEALPPRYDSKVSVQEEGSVLDSGFVSTVLLPKQNRFEVVRMDYVELTKLPEWLRRTKDLKVLDLDVNWLESLPNWLQELDQLEELSLSMNTLQEFPEVLKSMKGLRIIDLSQNEIQKIPDWLVGMSQLRQLDLRGNKIERSEIVELQRRLKDCQILN